MVAVERHGQYGASENVENDGVYIRVPFDQSEHRDPLPRMVWLLVPRGRALIGKI
jgi:hypothetical protein